MFKPKQKRNGFMPQENLISILPSVIAGIVVLPVIIATSLIYSPPQNQTVKTLMIAYGIAGSLYFAFYYLLYTAPFNKSIFAWINAVISGISMGLLSRVLSEELALLLFTLVFISAMSTALIAGRRPSYFLVICVTAISLLTHSNEPLPWHEWIIHFGLMISALMAVETVQQLKGVAKRQINRLEIVNELSKQIVSTLDAKRVYSLLNAAFQNALIADSYYIGIVHGEKLHLEIFFDEGEYFENVILDRKGTLSNWVITHQKELFLPDLRTEIQLEDVEMVLIGKNKTALSWMGVPMRGSHIDGVMAISSYKPNAFDRSDMELLSNIAQRAALALDNAYHHAHVEEQARLDSLTRVYNHGHFIQTLQKQAETCLAREQSLSLIMLDIDFFKQYNDTFGHLVGDEILVNLCGIIRSHIKHMDTVGRWGGEEFAISLPNTNGHQATQVAQRIQESMSSFKVRNDEHITIPSPTVSQGIAVFPDETNNIMNLIDLADKRLYTAKVRGRNQVEPAPEFREKTD